MITEDSFTIIDSLVRQGRSFALWRVPGEETVHFGMQTNGNPELIYDMAELDGRTV